MRDPLLHVKTPKAEYQIDGIMPGQVEDAPEVVNGTLSGSHDKKPIPFGRAGAVGVEPKTHGIAAVLG